MTVMTMLSNNNHISSTKGKKPYKSWLKDGVNGGPSSMEILIKWLSHKPNYKKWKREDYSIDRVPKKELLEEIIDKLRQVGIYHRLAKDVASKISTLQSNYRLTRKWNETEGVKLLEIGHCRKAIHDELLKRFPYWDTLHPVFGCRGSAMMNINNIILQPITTTTTTTRKLDLNSIISRYVLNSKLKEEKRLNQSRNMLYFLSQRKRQKMTQERFLIQNERLNTKLYFEKCLHEAGFTDTEISYFYNKKN